jgi:oligoendopeptidase F
MTVTQNNYQQEGWRLDELFTGFDAAELRAALAQIQEMGQQFENNRAQLSPQITADDFIRVLDAYEELVYQVTRVSYYGFLRFAADTQDQQAQVNVARFQQLGADLDNQTMFFKLWWKELDEQSARRLLEASGDRRYWLEALRLERPYTLSEAEEKIVNQKDVNGSQALMTLYDAITGRYTFELEVDDETRELTYGELTNFYRHPEPAVRQAAYQAQFKVYSHDAPILGQIYQYRVRDWHSEQVGLRGFASPIAARNLGNDIPDDVVEILLDVCRANAPLFQRYFQLKARWLGMERLRRYDIYAPVVETDQTYAFAEAVDLVLDSFRAFDPEIADLARRVFDDHHLDSEVRKGKRSGAFCATVVPELTPYVLQSYDGRPDDVATLAHELGHAIHSMLAEHHSLLTQQSSLPLAETASTFAEMLVIDWLLAGDLDPETRRDLLFRQMDSNYATIMRQAFFAIFERDAHDLILRGGSIDELSQLYAENLLEQFGQSIEISDDFSHEWAVIRHFFAVPFYVYAYSFGQLLVLSLYQQYLQEGETFKPRYLALLAAGGSDAPIRLLKQAGIDAHSPEFWQGGFDVLQAALEQLEELIVPEQS